MADTAKPEKQLHELLSHSLVDIYVGPDNTHWILHEKLLCAKSRFFQKIFYSKDSQGRSFGLPDEDDEAFSAFVAWLYSGYVKPAREEKDLTTLFDLYLMGEKWQTAGLVRDALREVRHWYAESDTYPGLRRVQYVYANTEEDSEMRRLLVHSVARMMALNENIPAHWDKALRKNGQLAVDLIKSIQSWRIDPQKVPDMRRAVEEGTKPASGAADDTKNKANDTANDAKNKTSDTANDTKGKADDATKDLQKLAEDFMSGGGPVKDLAANGVNGVKKATENGVAGKKPEEVKKELDENLPNGLDLPKANGVPDGLPAEDID